MWLAACGAVCVLLLAGSAHPALAQDGASEANALAFEVASVRENVGGTSGRYLVRPDGLSAIDIQLWYLIARAYGISLSLWPQFLMGGDPALLEKRFDIQANAGRKADAQEISMMLRSLLAERFRLRLKRETRRLPVYEAVLLREKRLGPQLRPGIHDCRAANEALRAKGELSSEAIVEAMATLRNARGERVCGDVSQPPASFMRRFRTSGRLAQLFRNSEGYAQRRIIDATGLEGLYEWTLDFSPAFNGGPDAPSIFLAYEEQLGLRLRPAFADLEVLVIESVEMPSEN